VVRAKYACVVSIGGWLVMAREARERTLISTGRSSNKVLRFATAKGVIRVSALRKERTVHSFGNCPEGVYQ
jgi:hypothetical protein